MTLSLRDLQMLTEQEFTVESTRADLGRIVDYFKSAEKHDVYVNYAFVGARQLPRWLADEIDVFFIPEDIIPAELPEDFLIEALGFVKYDEIVMSGRLVYPVKDVKGQVMGFCGWDKFVTPKYLDSKNHGYKAKATTFYGMEKLPEYYRSNKPVYVVEGIVDCLYLRSIGLQAIALLGSTITKYVYHILKRMEDRLVFIPDNDIIGKEIADINATIPAGEHFVQQVKRMFPKSRIIQSIIAKDVDDTRLLNDGMYEEDFKKELQQVAISPFYFFKTIRVR